MLKNTAVYSTKCTATARKMTRTVQLQAWRVHCPINAQIGLLITSHVREFCYSFDYKSNKVINRWPDKCKDE